MNMITGIAFSRYDIDGRLCLSRELEGSRQSKYFARAKVSATEMPHRLRDTISIC